MMHRLIRFSMVGTFALAISTTGLAYGQDDPDEDVEEAVDDTGDESGDDSAADDEVGGDEVGGDDTGGDTGGDAGNAGGKHGLTLPKGQIMILAPLNVNLSSDAVAKPISLSPDIWYGVDDKLSVGLTHSFFAATGFLGLDGQVGTGICFTGEENGCIKGFYDNVGVDAVYALSHSDSLQLAANGGVQALFLDPLALALKVGVKGIWTSGKLGVLFNPNISIGVTERDFNKERLNIPVGVGFMVNPKMHAMVQSGIAGDLDGFGDTFVVPLTLAAHYTVSEKLMVGGAFSFTQIIAGGDNGGADARTLSIMAGYML